MGFAVLVTVMSLVLAVLLFMTWRTSSDTVTHKTLAKTSGWVGLCAVLIIEGTVQYFGVRTEWDTLFFVHLFLAISSGVLYASLLKFNGLWNRVWHRRGGYLFFILFPGAVTTGLYKAWAGVM